MQRTLLIGACLTTIALSAASAAGQEPSRRACTSAYSHAEERARAGHLRQARELLLQCAKPACGDLADRCSSAEEEVAGQLAWLAPVVKDATGSPLVDVQVKMDGQPLTTHLDGKPLAVDPGVHEYSFNARVGAWPGHEVTLKRKMMLWQGQHGSLEVTLPGAGGGPKVAAAATEASAEAQKDQSTTAASAASDEPSLGGSAKQASDKTASDKAESKKSDSEQDASDKEASDKDSSDQDSEDAKPAPAPARPSAPHRGGPGALPGVLGGIGVASLGFGGLATYYGRSDNAALAACAPNCSQSSIDHVRRWYIAADVGWAAGGAAVGVASLLFIFSHPGEAKPTEKPSAARAPYKLGVKPTKSGALVTVQGAF